MEHLIDVHQKFYGHSLELSRIYFDQDLYYYAFFPASIMLVVCFFFFSIGNDSLSFDFFFPINLGCSS